MKPGRGMAVATALLCAALATAGCGLGAGAEVGEVELTVTREYGSVPVLERTLEAQESDTVMRLLEGNAEITTRFGGGFVQSIDGVAASEREGDPYDWFFYVDGVESPIGAAEYKVNGRERIWWDYRNWSATNHVPAVVGSWPAPFVAGYGGSRRPVVVECLGGGEICRQVREESDAAAQLEAGPEVSGVFGGFELVAGEGYSLIGLDPAGEAAEGFGPDAGLVAATRRFDAPPVWLVTGGTLDGVREAADSLKAATLRNRYAVAGVDGEVTPLPVQP